ncbi:MAG TPA: discoidin domain-containing protein [Pirellulaceae bacterium]|nr:discoidin domain-containing protein [Pirellulaceae bacterium]
MRTSLVSLLAVMVLGLLSQPILAQKTVSVTVRADSEAPGYEGHRAMDGNPSTLWHTVWGGSEPTHPHQIIVDLGAPYEISGFVYRARPDGGNGTVKDYECYVSDNKKAFGQPVVKGTLEDRHDDQKVKFPSKVKGRYVCFRALSEVNGKAWASIAELQLVSAGVRFLAKDSIGLPLVREDGTPLTELEVQYISLRHDLRKRANMLKIADEIYRPEASILETDRDPLDVVLRRTAALLADVRELTGAPDLSALQKALTELQADAQKAEVEEDEARFKIYEEVCRVRREIALSNPLLDFDKILFIKHHRSIYNHMCDQYYGMAAAPGGGLYVLQNAFGDQPTVRDVLADSVVQSGRLAGKRLDGGPNRPPAISFDGQGNVSGPKAEGGSFLSPDLSFDGKEIVFAYVECTGDPKHRHHTDASRGHWAEGRCYHVFKVNVDGSGLKQLTDGTWNDFDPCFLPNDRIAFISERRGGYLRCGRVCPTYTLYDMAAGGSDITCLSFHETNEWHPSVTNDGRVLWTRWDYVDRYGCIAHMPWVTTLDGRDPRAVHGNFAPRNARPDMELDCRAIPNSAKFIGTAAPHHGQAYGSLILIDPNIPDDDAMAPVKRITPEIRFPESQGGAQVYGTPWPLSEDYYLCVYDPSMQPKAGMQGRGFHPGNYGIYLVDAFGNKELIYRDPEIACLSPIPLKPRTRPPAAPNIARGGPETDPAARALLPPDEKAREGTMAVVNVYESLLPWPEGTEIKAIRVFQVLPMSVPSGGLRPHETGHRVASAGDSVVPARWVLGTAPVEADGSAHFVVPANRELFFQAIDEEGLAVQSMRSATHVREGERLVCSGCHEPKHRASQPSQEIAALALQRAPSRLTPDVDGSNPFSYPRLVQPVLDRHCVECHATHDKKPISLAAEPIVNHWFTSYNNLVKDYGFHDYGNGLRTTPGRFGAKASKLYEILKEGHFDVKLSKEEMHRITLWLDCTSMFYGVYERESGQAQLRGEIARPTLQ